MRWPGTESKWRSGDSTRADQKQYNMVGAEPSNMVTRPKAKVKQQLQTTWPETSWEGPGTMELKWSVTITAGPTWLQQSHSYWNAGTKYHYDTSRKKYNGSQLRGTAHQQHEGNEPEAIRDEQSGHISVVAIFIAKWASTSGETCLCCFQVSTCRRLVFFWISV